MDDGKVLATGHARELKAQTQTDELEAAFIALLPEEKRKDHKAVVILPRKAQDNEEIAIEAQDLTMRFGSFTAVDHVSFRIPKGEILVSSAPTAVVNPPP